MGEEVLITGAGPIGIDDDRLNLCNRETDAVTANVSRQDLKSVMQRIGMREGFDIGLKISGAAKAFDQIVDHMIMGGKIAMLGIPSGPTTGAC